MEDGKVCLAEQLLELRVDIFVGADPLHLRRVPSTCLLSNRENPLDSFRKGLISSFCCDKCFL